MRCICFQRQAKSHLYLIQENRVGKLDDNILGVFLPVLLQKMFSMAAVLQHFRKLSHQILGLIFQTKDQHWACEQIQLAFHYVIPYFLLSGISFISPHSFNTCLLVILPLFYSQLVSSSGTEILCCESG